MSKENKAIARKFIQMMEFGDASVADEILAPDFISHSTPDASASIERVKTTANMMKTAMPDAKASIEFQVAEGDKVVNHYTWSGTHQGDLFGIPATGKKVGWTVTSTFRIAGGKIREAWLNWDQWGLAEQIGMVRTPEG